MSYRAEDPPEDLLLGPQAATEYACREVTRGTETLTLQGTHVAITEGVLPACETCRPRLEEQAYLLTTWVAIGRLTAEKAVLVMNEQPCTHVELGQYMDTLIQSQVA